MKYPKKETALRLVILFVGLVIAHLGVTLFLLSSLGADPFNVLVQGVFRSLEQATTLGLSHGNVHRIICFGIILVLLVVDKSYVKLGTLVCMFCGGPIIDAFTWVLGLVLPAESPLYLRIAMLVLGCVILAFGMTLVIKSDAGTGPNDLVAVVISDKTKARFGIIRVAVDAAFVIVGILLGGTFGAGTVVCCVLVGPVADYFLPRNEKRVNCILQKCLKQEQVGNPAGEND